MLARAGRDVFRETLRGFSADRGMDLAGSLSFASLLTAVPLLATFSLIAATFFKENVDEIFGIVNLVLPYQAARLTENLRAFVRDSIAITGIGLLVLVISSLRLVFQVEAIFNAVWGAPRRRALVARVTIYTLSLLAFALFVGSLSLVYDALSTVPILGVALQTPLAEALLPMLAQFAALTIAYRFLPHARVRWSSALAGAGFAAVLLEALRFAFGAYVDALSRMNLITGSLALLMFTFLALYFVWVIVLFGVELTHVLETGKVRVGVAHSAAGKAETAIRILVELSRGDTMPVSALAESASLSMEEAGRCCLALQEAGLIEGDAKGGYRLARRASLITVAQAVEAVSPDLYALGRGADGVSQRLETAFARLAFERRLLLGATIADLRDA